VDLINDQKLLELRVHERLHQFKVIEEQQIWSVDFLEKQGDEHAQRYFLEHKLFDKIKLINKEKAEKITIKFLNFGKKDCVDFINNQKLLELRVQ
jgi:hypothetical protein